MSLQENLKKIREKHGLTKKELCRKTGISERAYLTYEFGEREPKISVIEKLADFYGITTDYLLGRGKQPEPLEQLYKMYDFKTLEKALSENYLKLPQEKREDFVEFLYRTVQLAKIDTPSAAFEETKSEFADVPTEQLLQETEAREAELSQRDLSAFQKQDKNSELA